MTGLRVTCLAPGELDDLAGALAAAKLPTADLAEPGRAFRRVPAVLVTGYDREAIPPAYRALQLIQKPICADALTEALVAPAGLRFDNLDLRAFDDLHSARDLNGAAFVNKKAAP